MIKMNYMIYILISILWITNSWSTVESQKSLSCSLSPTKLHYINGVWNEELDPRDSVRAIKFLVTDNQEKFDEKGEIRYFWTYNISESMLTDLIQVYTLKLGELGLNVEEIIRQFYLRQEKFCADEQNLEVCALLTNDFHLKGREAVFNSNETLKELSDSLYDTVSNKEKMILISHSQGNLYANLAVENVIKRGQQSNLEKYFGNLQVAPPVLSISAKNNRFILAAQDMVINALRLTLPLLIKVPNFFITNPIPLGSPDFHRFIDYYLSADLNFFGPKQGKFFHVSRRASTVFLDGLEEVAWMLANNDTDCCDGEDGRFYRADYDSEAQGFVASTVNIDDDVSFQISEDSQVCGKVTFDKFPPNSGEVHINNFSKILGTEQISVQGNLYLDHSYITNEADFLPLRLIGSEYDFPLYFENSYVTGPSIIKGPIVFNDAYVEDVNEIFGNSYIPPGQQFMYTPQINNAAIFHGSVLNGFYYVERTLEASVVQGKTKIKPDGTWGSTFVNAHSYGLTNVSVIDHVSVSGQVDPNTFLEGFILNGNPNGVIVGPGSRVYGGSSLHGSVVLGPSEFRGYWSGGTNVNGDSGYLRSGFIINPPISYDPNPYYEKVVTGAPYVDGTSIYNTNISGTPSIIGGSLSSCNVSCNAILTGETAHGLTFGCGYQTGQKEKPEYSRELDLNDEQFSYLKQKNEDKINEVLAKLEDLRR